MEIAFFQQKISFFDWGDKLIFVARKIEKEI